ncbi:hypothetical protein [Ornithinimicrobium pekingense]|uniref:Baseplate assembly protein n=1 Tax=Ornithinimicrobium pekingense TaxID=384677 RepID=A0ABQ2F6R7_9MICO|nr:hypothetical protein [Ornithinimicrobium pekingense]GGK63472.1 putative baseplate assembly protein [Ornithinimicrobium pekingense]
MPLFPPVTDTLRWRDLVRQGRAQLPIVAPAWTDQNVSDPGIAALELLAWSVEADSYRSSAVTDRERRLLLSLVGMPPRAPRPATCLLGLSSTAARIPAGLGLSGLLEEEETPLTLLDDVALTGATLAVVAHAAPGAGDEEYRSGATDLTRALTAGRTVHPFGTDPRPGDAVVLGLLPPGGSLSGTLDLWLVPEAGLCGPERAAAGPGHHDARTGWEAWDGTAWEALDAEDDTAALTAPGRVRLELPMVPVTVLGDQATGVLAGHSCAWVRCRIDAGRHDVAPALAALHVDVGEAVATAPYSTSVTVPSDATVSGAPSAGQPFPRAVVGLVCSADGRVLALSLDPPGGTEGLPVVDVVRWVAPTAGTSGRLVADLAVLGVATGVPEETFRLPHPWCGQPPALWVTEPDGTTSPVRVLPDLAVAHATEYAAAPDPDGLSLRFGDGRQGATLTPGATVLATGRWTTAPGLGGLTPPTGVRLTDDDRTAVLLGGHVGATHAALVAGRESGAPAEGTRQAAARAEATLMVHDRLRAAVELTGGRSLDDLPLAAVRQLGVPERGVTALDLERIALATAGTALRRARALPEVDPRLPGVRADGCVTVVVVPGLPVGRPTPSAGLLARVRGRLAAARTLGTRVFVVGPDYVEVGVRAHLVTRPGRSAAAVVTEATRALETFLDPVTGGPAGLGWPFGRTVRRTEVLQLLDALAAVDRVEHLALSTPGCPDGCGDIPVSGTHLVVAGRLDLTAGGPR